MEPTGMDHLSYEKMSDKDVDMGRNIPDVTGIGLHAQYSHESPHVVFHEDQRDFAGGLISAAVSSATKTPTALQRLFTIIKDNTTTIVNMLLLVFILFLEIILKESLFTCPCNSSDLLYAVVFVLGPAVTLFTIGIFASNITWQLTTGCVRRSPESAHGLKNGCYYICILMSRSLLAPVAWVVYSFIDGNFYHCATAENPCGTTEADLAERSRLVGRSQIIGFFMLIVVSTASLISLLIFRSVSRLTYEQFNYIRAYSNIERVEIQKRFEEHALNRARRNVLLFLEKETRPKEEWDNISVVPLVGPDRDLLANKDGEYWTPLQKLVRKERKERMNKPSVTTQTSGSKL